MHARQLRFFAVRNYHSLATLSQVFNIKVFGAVLGDVKQLVFAAEKCLSSLPQANSAIVRGDYLISPNLKLASLCMRQNLP
jgi:hypothetical protein